MKSERVGAAWAEKKNDARKNGTIQTTRLPAWLEVVGRKRVGKHVSGGEFRVIPERVAVVKRMFDMVCNGYGLSLIVKQLTADKVETWGRGGAWSKAYVHKIIAGRIVLGEYQPRKGAEPEGEPIPDYYPTVIDEATWLQAQAALARRREKPGRLGNKVPALFSGLLHDARTQGRMLIAWQTRGVKGKTRQRARVLVSASSMEGRTPSVSFPAAVFEEAVLSKLDEIDPADVIGEEPAGESVELTSELTVMEHRRQQIEEQLAGTDGDVAALARVLRTVDEKCQDLRRRRDEAKRKESRPRGEAWAEMKTLLKLAQDEPTRLRLRDLLRATIEDVWVLTVAIPGRSRRLAAVQINFVDGARRDYLIRYTAAGNGRPGGWEATSLRWEGSDKADGKELDLRRNEDTDELASILAAFDIGQ